MATETFHSKILGENLMSSVMVVRHAIWAEAVHIIDKAAEAEVAPLDIKVQHLQLLLVVAEQAAMAAGLTKQVQKAQMGFAAYSIIIFQALPLLVLQKKFLSLNADKDFENI